MVCRIQHTAIAKDNHASNAAALPLPPPSIPRLSPAKALEFLKSANTALDPAFAHYPSNLFTKMPDEPCY